MKRDYKDFTDLVISQGVARRVTPTERLRLMGFPDDWHVEPSTKTDKYAYCGMSVNAVNYIANCVMDFDKSL